MEDWVEVILKAIPLLYPWLYSTADIILTATPKFGGWVIGGLLAGGLGLGMYFLVDKEI